MDDLRQLLRYELPGLLAIIYFVIFTYPILYENGKLIGLDPTILIKVFSGLAILLPILALPIGYFLYQTYLFFEHNNFLSKRAGNNLVSKILKDNSIEKQWWDNKETNIAQRNEILDINFYAKEKRLANILERFEGFYHSRRVIGIYTPVLSTIFTAIVILNISCSSKTPLCKILSSYSSIYILITFIIVFFSVITVLPTMKGGFLRNEINELERNILLRKEKDIKETIKSRVKLDNKIKMN